MARLEAVEGIGPKHAASLGKANVGSLAALLSTGGTAAGRKEIAKKSGVSEKLILEWVNHADLMRIRGVGEEYADLLEAAGVDSVPELAQRKAANLVRAMADVNEKKKLVRRVPTEAQVADWCRQAKQLPKLVTH